MYTWAPDIDEHFPGRYLVVIRSEISFVTNTMILIVGPQSREQYLRNYGYRI